MNYYPFHIGDYAAHTQRLSLMEDLAYRRLIDAYYLAERPFIGSSTDVAREIGMLEQLQAVEYVLSKFFEPIDGGFSNVRCDKEIARYHDKQVKASNAGKASAQRRSNGRSTDVETKATDVGNSSTDEQLTNNQEPITNISTTSVVDSPVTPPSPKARRKQQFPADFYPNETGQAAATAKGIVIARELERFRDYHMAKGNTMADWQAAWRTWVGNARPTVAQPMTYLERDELLKRKRYEEMTGRTHPDNLPKAEVVDAEFFDTTRRIA